MEAAAGWVDSWGAWARPLGMRDSTSRDAIRLGGKEPESCFEVVVAWELGVWETLQLCWWPKPKHQRTYEKRKV